MPFQSCLPQIRIIEPGRWKKKISIRPADMRKNVSVLLLMSKIYFTYDKLLTGKLHIKFHFERYVKFDTTLLYPHKSF
jgi:hypothetical protein